MNKNESELLNLIESIYNEKNPWISPVSQMHDVEINQAFEVSSALIQSSHEGKEDLNCLNKVFTETCQNGSHNECPRSELMGLMNLFETIFSTHSASLSPMGNNYSVDHESIYQTTDLKAVSPNSFLKYSQRKSLIGPLLDQINRYSSKRFGKSPSQGYHDLTQSFTQKDQKIIQQIIFKMKTLYPDQFLSWFSKEVHLEI